MSPVSFASRAAGLVLSGILFAPAASAADDSSGVLALKGSLRLRYETLSGQPRAGLSATDQLVSIRTTLAGEYRRQAWRLGAELYDSRAYGGDAAGAVGATDVNAFELAQAYIGGQFRQPLRAPGTIDLEAGRMILNLGSRRLVSADDYRNTTTTMTGLRATYVRDDVTATGLYVLPTMHRPDDKSSVLDNAVQFDRESFDLVLWGALLSKTRFVGGTELDFSYFHLAERDSPNRPTRDRKLDTFGPRLLLVPKAGAGDFETEAFYQSGAVSESTNAAARTLAVSAWFLHLAAGYTWDIAWHPRLSLQYDYASGDGRGSRYTHFDTLFGMRRVDLAPYGIYGVLSRSNVDTPALRLEAAPSDRLDWFVNYRLLWLASASDAFSSSGVRDASGNSGAFAGQQIEARMRYWLLPDELLLEADGALLLKGHFLKRAPNAPPTGDTTYISFNVTRFF
jgi:hypothetical protein